MTFDTPILFIIFNRPDVTKAVFDKIKDAKPSTLYISADGPRKDSPNDNKLCEQTRKITEQIDWQCKVFRRYSDKNLGCKIGVSNAINWFFENVDEGIILEDDCLPNLSFFNYCKELLKKYRDVDRIKMITGDNFNFGKVFGNESYYFSQIPSIWGWATWRRAWSEYDLEMETYPKFSETNTIKNIFKNKEIQKYWTRMFDNLYKNEIDTWDGQWVYSIYNKKGICIRPNVNLVENIGFNKDATHTKSSHKLANIPNVDMEVLTHPQTIEVSEEADEYLFNSIMKSTLLQKIISKILNK